MAQALEIILPMMAMGGLVTLVAASGQEAIEIAQAHRTNLILLALIMPGCEGRRCCQL